MPVAKNTSNIGGSVNKNENTTKKEPVTEGSSQLQTLKDIEEKLGKIDTQLKELKAGDKRNRLIGVFAFEGSYIVAGITLVVSTIGRAQTVGFVLGGIGIVSFLLSAAGTIWKQNQIKRGTKIN